ncbi:MAG TPA: hypothetical protein VGN09_06775 [Vicinamibacteria bacterium]
MANGKRAARSIHQLVAGERAALERTLEIEEIPTSRYRMLAGFEVLDREAPPTLDLGRPEPVFRQPHDAYSGT